MNAPTLVRSLPGHVSCSTPTRGCSIPETPTLTGSVSAVTGAELVSVPAANVSNTIAGKLPGVVTVNTSGEPGYDGASIRIRGNHTLNDNSPLVVVDGVPGRAGGLERLSPQDIESISVLKDASAAIYGSRAANGVILITTKRGRPGNTQWTAFVETGRIDDVTDYPGNYLAFDDLGTGNPMFNAAGTAFNFTDYPACPNQNAAAGTCEQDGTLFFNTLEDSRTRFWDPGSRQRYGASVRGGTEDVRFFVSGQYEDETGIVQMNTQEKSNVRANLDARLAPTVDLSVSFGYAQNQLALNNNDNSIFSPIINGLLGQPFYVPAIEGDEINDPVNNANYGFGFNMAQLGFLPTFGDVDRSTTSANVRWRPTSWLTFNATGGLDLTSGHQQETLQPDRLPIAASYAAGYRASERYTNYLYTAQASGVGTFSLMPNLLATTTVGGSYNRDNEEGTYCYGSALVPGTASCGTVSNLYSIDEDFFEVRTIGGYVQQELAWNDRVFVAAGLRGDRNSAFGQDLGFEYYPSASLSWVILEEPWFPQMDFLNTLRLRGAWGVSGLRPGFRDASTLYSPATVATAGGDVPGVSLNVTGNPQLEPERTTEYEFGLDTGLFDDRLSLEFTYFNKKSEDALIQRRLPGSLGLTTTVWQNLGSIRNAGTELVANLMVFESQDFGVNLGFTNTSLDNEVLEIGADVEDIIFNRGLQRHTEGRPAGAFFQPVVTWDDADGNGLLTQSEVTVGEEVYIGPALPTWQRTLFADVRLFDFLTVSTLFEGRGGHFTGNDTEAFRCGYRSTRGCAAVGDPNASLEEQAAYLADRFLGSTYGYVEKADFYKWRELSLSFSTPSAWAQRFSQLDGLRLTLAGRNLATFTDYPGLDPETVEGGGNANFSQSEFNTQPPVRYLMLRLDYSF